MAVPELIEEAQSISQLQARRETCESSRAGHCLPHCLQPLARFWLLCLISHPGSGGVDTTAWPEPIEILPPMSLPAEEWSRPLHASSSGVTVQTRRLRVVV